MRRAIYSFVIKLVAHVYLKLGLSKIHWDCGKPDFSTLRQELDERLIVVGRDKFNIPAQETQRLADVLIYRVLKKSIGKTPKDRVLIRSELYTTIDLISRLSIPRAAFEFFVAQLTSGMAGEFAGGPGAGGTLRLKSLAG